MGSQSIIFPFRRVRAFVWLALVFLSTGSAMGQAVSALVVPLLLPSAVAFDSQGNLYVAETGNHVIRQIDTSGNITSIAGSNVQGFYGDGGAAVAAQFDSPQGLAMDAAGDLYIADTHNHRIRRVAAATQQVTTIAGTGAAGFSGDGGSAVAAQLDLPTALALDTAGDLYVADGANHRIRRIDAISGNIITVAGTGTQGFSGDNGSATAAAIDSPAGLAVDAAGNVYFADTHSQRVRRVDASTGIISTVAGNGAFGFIADGSATTALALPQGLSFDTAGDLYFADRANHRIRRIDAVTGQISTVAGNGTEGFSGDGGPAVGASLDNPRATSLSVGGLVTLADTGNQRVRQLQSDPAASTIINTLGGIGQSALGVLTLAAPSVIAYGSGTITASLATTSAATGNIILLDTTTSSTSTLATLALSGATAVVSTASLPAGKHSITATYSGDAAHSAAQSGVLAITVNPQPLLAVAMPASLLYGQPIPSVSGSETGLLAQDVGAVTITFLTTASGLASTGSYPITATIAGTAAGNYALSVTSAVLTINPSPSKTTISASAASIASGSPAILTMQVVSMIAGIPTGTVVLLDSGTSIATAPINASGGYALTDTALVVGTHSFTAVYSGDTNFTGSTSAPAAVIVGSVGSTAAPDFSFAATGVTAQTVVSGNPASFTFTETSQGSLSSAINLTATGLPLGATASFNPAYIPPGATAPTITLTITTPNQARLFSTAPIAFGLIVLPFAIFTRRRMLRLGLVALLFVVGGATGCGDRVNSGAQSSSPTVSYAITVTGTATSSTGEILSHSFVVHLGIQSGV